LQDPTTITPGSIPARPARPPQAEVPPTRADRERVRRAARAHVAAERLVPPLSLEELQAHARRVLERAGLDPRHEKFATVLVSNASWADTMAGIPPERRLLLLPQCLRDEEACRAELDEFGLVCGHCGRCPIHHLQAEAERLGYVVLVAEGTAVVTALIESGRIDAIVGVSCLSVLERVFPFMEAGAIPGIAIPLLQDGCANTSVDLDWVWEAIQLTSADATRRLDLDALRAEVAAWFTPQGLEQVLGPARSRTERLARGWLARSGKRWRPFLAVCAFQALQHDPAAPLPDDLRRLAVAIECFHKASLVHDDIEDNDALRYGQKTLHAEHGIPVALNVGDFLLGEGYRMIAEADGRPERGAAMLRVATSGHRSLCVGQGEELCWMREPAPLRPTQVVEIFRQKTAPAFEVALRLGAIRAGADGEIGRLLSDYSAALGIAYQIRDELLDFHDEVDRPDGAMSPSILLALASERAEGDLAALLQASWRRPWRSSALRHEIEKALDHLHVHDAARQLLDAYKQKAIRSLRTLDSPCLKGLLRRVVGKIFDETPPEGQP